MQTFAHLKPARPPHPAPPTPPERVRARAPRAVPEAAAAQDVEDHVEDGYDYLCGVNKG